MVFSSPAGLHLSSVSSVSRQSSTLRWAEQDNLSTPARLPEEVSYLMVMIGDWKICSRNKSIYMLKSNSPHQYKTGLQSLKPALMCHVPKQELFRMMPCCKMTQMEPNHLWIPNCKNNILLQKEQILPGGHVGEEQLRPLHTSRSMLYAKYK